MTINIDKSQRLEIANAIKAQETNTSGEIYCVVARRSDDYSDIITLYAILAALILPLIIGFFGFDFNQFFGAKFSGWTTGTAERNLMSDIWPMIGLQTIIFIIGALIAKNPKISNLLVPKFIKRQVVHKAAIDQFNSHGIAQTEGQTGVLIYVSLAEHMVEILADKGIYSKVDKSIWGDAIAKILLHTKSGNMSLGLIEGIEMVGAILAQHFPPSATNHNELTDGVVFI